MSLVTLLLNNPQLRLQQFKNIRMARPIVFPNTDWISHFCIELSKNLNFSVNGGVRKYVTWFHTQSTTEWEFKYEPKLHTKCR